MKKIILFVAIGLLALTSIHAQIMNRTYQRNSLDMYPKCIIPKLPDSNVFMSSSLTFSGKNLALQLTKTDMAGNVLTTLEIDTPFVNHRIAATDSGIILASYMDSNLYVLNFDNNLTLKWSKRIPVGIATFAQWGDVDILMDHDLFGQPVYYITHVAKSPQDAYDRTAYAFGVLKLSSSGNLIWHKTFSQSGPSPIYTQDQPSTIIQIDTTGNKKFVIAGMRQEAARYLFAISIDQDGNILNNYKRIQTFTNNPVQPQAVWDPYNNKIACVFREKIGIMTLDNNLNPLTGRMFDGFCFNLPYSITLQGDSSYVLGLFINDCQSPKGFTAVTPGLLKIDPATLNFQMFARYDTAGYTFNEGYHKTDELGYNYLVPRNAKGTLSGGNSQMRFIKTDPVLYTCGVHYDQISSQDWAPMGIDYQYVADSDTVIDNFNFVFQQPQLTYNDCNDSNQDGYKSGTTGIFATNISAGLATSVYPTVLHSQNETVHCVIICPKAATVTLTVTDVLGRKIYRKEARLVSGQNNFDISANFSDGLNSLAIDIDSKRVDIKKIVVQQ